MTDTTEDPVYDLHDSELRALGLGLSGAHRTGKTTLAARLAKSNNCPFVQTSMSALANEMGIKIGLDMPFAQRRALQEAALVLFEKTYEEQGSGILFITDRTPIELAAYVITAWHPSVVGDPELDAWAYDYVKRCIEATNRWFLTLVIIQPSSIPFVEASQKGEDIDIYREALNYTMMGLAWDDQIRTHVNIMPRDLIDLADRSSYVAKDYTENISEYAQVLRTSLTLQ